MIFHEPARSPKPFLSSNHSAAQARKPIVSKVRRPVGINEPFKIEGALHIFDVACDILSDKGLFPKMTFRHRPLSVPTAGQQARQRLYTDVMSSGWAADAQKLVGNADILAFNVFTDKTSLTTNKSSYAFRVALANLPTEELRKPEASRQVGIIKEAVASSSHAISAKDLQAYNEASFHDCLKQVFDPLISAQRTGVDLEVDGFLRRFHPLVALISCDWPEAQKHALLNSVDGTCPCRKCVTRKDSFVDLAVPLEERKWAEMEANLKTASILGRFEQPEKIPVAA